ncbi:hypothetical protein B2J88_28675 [Rhodococcus sp. SRB_17]|nr:hypothetical protein [Rhodococcus sp. SRB_17]
MTRSKLVRIYRISILGICVALPLSLSAMPAAADVPGPSVTIRVDATKPGRVIPQDFIGLSFEANLMHQAWIDPAAGNVDTLLENLGTGNLRFSANQVDNTAWMPDPDAPVPAWAKEGQHVTPDDLSRVGKLAEATGWSVDLGVNFAHFDPAAAGNQAREAQERIGNSLRSIQIGNEPNFYLIAPISKAGDRRPLLPATYVPDARAYRDAIRAAAPGVPIEGPNTAGAGIGNQLIDPVIASAVVNPWLDTYISAFGSESMFLNQHYYPYVNTARVGFTSASSDLIGGLPSVDKLMSRDNSVKQTTFIRDFVAKAEHAGLEPKLAETNSVAKEGKEGVTNSFGAALWTVDYLMTAAREGVTGINLHNQPDDCESYSLICFADDNARQAGQAQANPNYYGLLMLSQLVGGQILPTTVESGAANVSAYAVRLPDGAVKVIVNSMDRAFNGDVNVEIVGEDGTSASVQRLTAASPDAVDGATFANSTVAKNGTFTPSSNENALGTDGRYRVRIDAPSAVLLTVD